ncbi:hypothetical protein ACFQDE_10915 [Deinococcus caeni]|uniref:hypothetical protein n=1 Tax=Deinococcus caeni TaxID=569127 RepID=UPI003605EAF7
MTITVSGAGLGVACTSQRVRRSVVSGGTSSRSRKRPVPALASTRPSLPSCPSFGAFCVTTASGTRITFLSMVICTPPVPVSLNTARVGAPSGSSGSGWHSANTPVVSSVPVFTITMRRSLPSFSLRRTRVRLDCSALASGAASGATSGLTSGSVSGGDGCGAVPIGTAWAGGLGLACCARPPGTAPVTASSAVRSAVTVRRVRGMRAVYFPFPVVVTSRRAA